MTFGCGVCHVSQLMECDDSVIGGGASEQAVDLTSDAGLDEWDLSFTRLRNAGLDDFSEAAGRSVSYEPSVRHEAVDASSSSFGPFNFQNALRHDSLSRSVVLPELPWETSAWKFIFSDDHDMLEAVDPSRVFSDPPMLAIPGGAEELVGELISSKKRERPVGPTEPFFLQAVSHRQDVAWEERREADMQKGLMKWMGVIRAWPEHWKVCGELNDCSTLEEACTLISHYLSGKAPSTLVKRANSVIFVMEQGHKLGYFFPYTEPELYSLLKTLKSSGFTSSRLKGVLEALTLCRHVFNLDEIHDLTVSKRCFGAIATGPVEKAKQAAPLKMADLISLHETLAGSKDPWDKVMAGACLFCVYSRARWSDFIHGGHIELDFLSDGSIAYVEMQVAVHKTMFASARRFRFLDLVAPGLGVHGDNWVQQWIDSLKFLNIDPFAAHRGCLMPAPDSHGYPLQRAIETDEAGCWLRLLLGEALKRSDSSRLLSSHSLKSTMLTFAAKRGIDHQDRLSLGHHAHPFQMADVYARDAQARNLRILDELIAELRSGAFCPDESRAGRFKEQGRSEIDGRCATSKGFATVLPPTKRLLEEVGNGEQNQKAGDDTLEKDDVDSEHVTTDSSSDSESEDEREVVPRQFMPPVAPSGFSFLKHRKSKLLHYIADDITKTLACGRVRTHVYIDPGELRYDSAVCHACQKSASKD